MSIPLTVNGVTFQFPAAFDKNWAAPVDNWAIAMTNIVKPLTGGFLTLSPFPSSGISFANATNTGFLTLTVNGSNQLTFNGSPIGATTTLTNTHIFVGNVSNFPADVALSGDATITNTGTLTIANLAINDAKIATLANIALSKLAPTTAYYWYAANTAGVLTPLAVTASRVVITDANGLPSTSSVTPTTLAFLDATSSVQTQINSKVSKAGDTMSGVLNMGSNKIQSLAAGASTGEAVAYQQLNPGKIVRTTYISPTVNNSTSSASAVTTGISTSFTALYATSLIKISATITGALAGSSAGRFFIAIDGTVALTASSIGLQNTGSGTMATGVALQYFGTVGDTSAHTYAIYYALDSGTTIFAGQNTVASFLIEEIAQ